MCVATGWLGRAKFPELPLSFRGATRARQHTVGLTREGGNSPPPPHQSNPSAVPPSGGSRVPAVITLGVVVCAQVLAAAPFYSPRTHALGSTGVAA